MNIVLALANNLHLLVLINNITSSRSSSQLNGVCLLSPGNSKVLIRGTESQELTILSSRLNRCVKSLSNLKQLLTCTASISCNRKDSSTQTSSVKLCFSAGSAWHQH